MFSHSRHCASLARAHHGHEPGIEFLLDRAVDDLIERLGVVMREFERGLALFGRTPRLADLMQRSGKIGEVLRIEERVHLGCCEHIVSLDDLGLDENSLDVVLAPFGLHWANDLPGIMVQLHRALRPNGLLMAVLPGPDTLNELRASLLATESQFAAGAALRVDPFTDVQDAGGLLQRAGFALPVIDRDNVTVRYNTVFNLISDLRGFGANCQLADRPPALSRQVALEMARHYGDHFSDADGRVRATFSLVHLSGWVPHDSQQKPLKPGSAKIRLADALRADEVKL